MAAGGREELGAAVFEASSSGNVSRLKELLRFKRFSKIRGCLSWRDPFDRTPLMAASAAGHLEMVKLLVEEYRVDVEESKFAEMTGEEFTALVYAANVGHHRVVDVLLKNSSKVDHAYPLHRACFAGSPGNLECVKLLLQHGADVNRKYKQQKQIYEVGELVDEDTPLAVASEGVFPKIVQFLLENGADPNIPNKKGDCPLHLAFGAIWGPHSERKCSGSCIRDGQKVVRMLVEHGARQSRNAMDLSPVMIGALTGYLSHFANELFVFRLSQLETVVALELLATHFLLNQDQHQNGYKILYKAKDLHKSLGPSEETTDNSCPYGDYNEPSKCTDLKLLESDQTYLQVVALMIRGRILCAEAQKNYLWQAIRHFADRCPPTSDGRLLALRALGHEIDLEIESGLFCGFAVESLNQLLDPSQISISDSNLEKLVILLKLEAINLSPHVSNMDPERRKSAIRYQRYKSALVFNLLALYANYTHLSNDDKELVMTLVQQFVAACDAATDVIAYLHKSEHGHDTHPPGLSVLHMYVPIVERMYRRQGPERSSTERMVIFLLKSGVNPNQCTPNGYTALHKFVDSCPSAVQTDAFRKGIVTPLVEWGCSVHERNPYTNRTAIDDCKNEETKQLLLDLALPTLLRLAARVIRKNRIQYSYRGTLPATFKALLDMEA